MSQEEKEQHLREGSEGKGNNQLCPSTERAISGVSATWVGVFKERLAPHSSGLLWKTFKHQGLDRGALQPLLSLRSGGLQEKAEK